jgi:hypothetical protein
VGLRIVVEDWKKKKVLRLKKRQVSFVFPLLCLFSAEVAVVNVLKP